MDFETPPQPQEITTPSVEGYGHFLELTHSVKELLVTETKHIIIHDC